MAVMSWAIGVTVSYNAALYICVSLFAVTSRQPRGNGYLLDFSLPQVSGRLSTHLYLWLCQVRVATSFR